MSDTVRPKSGGDKVSADEVNQDLPVQGTGGETINGETLPVAVFVNVSDNELYKCDADDLDKICFVGFVVNNTTDGNPATLQSHGIVSGFSGLSEGRKYYLNGASGGIAEYGVDYKVLVGIAISATELKIMVSFMNYQTTISDDLQHSNDASKTTTSITLVKVKEILLENVLDQVRIRFALESDDGVQVQAQIYKNGGAIGTLQSEVGAGPQFFQEDFEGFVDGDLIQIYARHSVGAPAFADVTNFRLYYANEIEDLSPPGFTNQDP